MFFFSRYDLSDVSPDQLSERSNRAAATDFLTSLTAQQTVCDTTESRPANDADETGTAKHTFKRPSKAAGGSNVAARLSVIAASCQRGWCAPCGTSGPLDCAESPRRGSHEHLSASALEPLSPEQFRSAVNLNRNLSLQLQGSLK